MDNSSHVSSSSGNSAKDKDKIFPSFTELRIYPSFSEIREKFNAPQNFKMYFPREVYEQIVQGSLSVEGLPVATQTAVTKANNLEGQTVFIHRSREAPIECLVIRPTDLLLKDVKSNRYIRASAYDLEYVTIPEEEGTEVTFALKQSGDAILCYLIQGITWSPRYNLKVDRTNDQHLFEAWADMTNSTKRDYKIKHTELFGGDVKLQNVNNYRYEAQSYSCCCECSALGGSNEEIKIESQGEIAGLYYYSIDQSFILASQSTFSLPFVEVNIKLEKYSKVELYFLERTQKGKFQRIYRIEGDKFLPAGTCTVREDGRVVGQAKLPDMGVKDKHDLECGSEVDVGYNREVNVLSKKRHSASFSIKLSIKNTKEKRSMKYEYSEIIQGKFVVTPKGENNRNDLLNITPNGFKIVNELQANGDTHVFEYEVHLDYKTNDDEDEK